MTSTFSVLALFLLLLGSPDGAARRCALGGARLGMGVGELQSLLRPNDEEPLVVAEPSTGELFRVTTHVTWLAQDGQLTSEATEDGVVVGLSAGQGVLFSVGGHKLMLGASTVAELFEALGEPRIITTRCTRPIENGPEIRDAALTVCCDSSSVAEIALELPAPHLRLDCSTEIPSGQAQGLRLTGVYLRRAPDIQ